MHVCACAFVCLIESIVLKVKGYCAALLAVLPHLLHLHRHLPSLPLATHYCCCCCCFFQLCNAEVSIDVLYAPDGRQRFLRKFPFDQTTFHPSLKSRQHF